jgi:hypothetical protein
MGEKMTNPARNIIPMHSHPASIIRTGRVESVISGDIRITVSGDILTAKKAFSCIIAPEPDDLVLFTEDEKGEVYVLGIIERPKNQNATLAFPSHTRIDVSHGSLNIHAGDQVTLAASGLNYLSNRAVHKSREAVVAYDKITAAGTEIQASFKTVRILSHLINTMAKQAIQRFQGYIRNTENTDMIKAGQMTRCAEGLYAVDSNQTVMKSKKNTIIDGEKILMG